MAEAQVGATPRNLPVRAVLYMFAAVSALAVLDAAVKWLTTGYSVPQIAFLRYIVGLGLAIALALRLGGVRTLRTRRLPGHALRSVFNIATMLTFYYALALMPLADAVAIAFAAPLFMTALSVPMLRERVGPRRWTAVVIGFAGVLIILRPSGAGLDLAALLALTSALLYALTLISSRQLSTTEPSHTILFYYSVSVLLATGAVLPWQWTTPSLADVWIFLLAGVAGSFGQFFLAQAFRYGEVSLLAPIEYSALLWAILFGFVLWGEVPSWTVLGGAALVIASSLYIVHREAVTARRQLPNPGSAG
ncbi:DMT family transporter [Rhodospirillaceae bacterium SYSU D60014]|uniref:DMT family transporter n=1 Tax=Virgifigura deserti TaxID=2268457 RepID=UPI000E66C103